MNDLEKDNWLQEEIERESRISAWDFDEGKKLRLEHEENCDARFEEEYHHSRHSNLNETTLNSDLQGEDHRKIDTEQLSGNTLVSKLFTFCFISVFVLMFTGADTYAILAFLGVNPGIFIMLLFTKGKPFRKETLPYWLLLALYDAAMIVRKIYLLFDYTVSR